MLHRELLQSIAGLDASPFGADAKLTAQALVEETGLEASIESASSSPAATFLLLWRCVAAARTTGPD